MSYLLDSCTDYENASRVSSGKAGEMYDNFSGTVGDAINGDTRSRAEFCRSHADIVAGNAISELERKSAFGLQMFDLQKQAASNWWGLSQRLYEKAEADE